MGSKLDITILKFNPRSYTNVNGKLYFRLPSGEIATENDSNIALSVTPQDIVQLITHKNDTCEIIF